MNRDAAFVGSDGDHHGYPSCLCTLLHGAQTGALLVRQGGGNDEYE